MITVKGYSWEKFLNRQFPPLIASLICDAATRDDFKKIGFAGLYYDAVLWQDCFWYQSKDIWPRTVMRINPIMAKKSVHSVCAALERFRKKSIKDIQKALKSKNPKTKFAKIAEILRTACTYMWLAHVLEEKYEKELIRIAPQYVSGDVTAFIAQATYPDKENALGLMEHALRKKASPKSVAKKFGWIKCRHNFVAPFSEADILELQKKVSPKHKHQYPKIPVALKKLVHECRDLVWFRTARADVLYELLFLSRPAFEEIALYYKIPFSDLVNYSMGSLLAGSPKKYSSTFSMMCTEEGIEYSAVPFSIVVDHTAVFEVKGVVAQPGYAKGIAKIVKNVSQIAKVNEGDILITQMTFPSFISAMYKAAAFVTDEGGITCHAAIVARELKKPCVIATKKASAVFKDGDLVEVDANRGVVKKVA